MRRRTGAHAGVERVASSSSRAANQPTPRASGRRRVPSHPAGQALRWRAAWAMDASYVPSGSRVGRA
eukprot:CAMPEP_0183343132 /NCGR_PEP_ID=MMETSP0164_2-20130417/9107_1 /TAXON_ID=221442 /ORGANISM="Coccolithus pelagicus ssp braarudi, Strain PLY182g" /LENGTH=66 /DNA_ID=CAMNT_0025513887 /DNA_START=353 /DNA_END=553 /DNA_ORIENTATION=-